MVLGNKVQEIGWSKLVEGLIREKKSMCLEIGSQWSSCRMGVMRCQDLVCVSLAAEF